MEGRGEHAALADRHRVALPGRQHLHPVAGPLHPGRPDEDRAQRLLPRPGHLEVRLEALQLPAEGVAPRGHVDEAEVLVIADDQPGAGAEDRPPRLVMGDQPRLESRRGDQPRHRRRLAARDHQAVESLQPLRRARPRPLPRRAGAASSGAPRSRPAGLERLPSGQLPRCWSRASWASSGRSRGRSSPRRGRSRRRRPAPGPRNGWSPRRSPWRGAPGSDDLKIPEPTKLPSAPSCIISAASAGVAIPPAQKSGTGRRPAAATSLDDLERRGKFFGGGGELLRRAAARAAGCRR